MAVRKVPGGWKVAGSSKGTCKTKQAVSKAIHAPKTAKGKK